MFVFLWFKKINIFIDLINKLYNCIFIIYVFSENFVDLYFIEFL